MEGLSRSIFPRFWGVELQFFAPLCYTIRMPEKIALVTGASSGFGLLTSIELARAGYRVVATMRDLGRRDRLDQAVAAGGVAAKIDVRALDVTKFETIQGFVDGVVRDYGHLDVLVNNAGFAVAGFAEDIKLDELRLQFETNFFGAVAMTKAALPTMRRQHSGHIIQVSSISGLHGSVTVSSYSASKHALEGWSESLRMEVNSLGIQGCAGRTGSVSDRHLDARSGHGRASYERDISQYSTEPAHARTRPETPQGRSDRGGTRHCCHRPRPEPQAALSGGARR